MIGIIEKLLNMDHYDLEAVFTPAIVNMLILDMYPPALTREHCMVASCPNHCRVTCCRGSAHPFHNAPLPWYFANGI